MNNGKITKWIAFLDVMLLLLLWLTMQFQEEQAQLKADTQAQLAQADRQVEEAVQEMERIRIEAEEEIADVWRTAEEWNQNSFANQKAMDNFAQGKVLTIYLEYLPEGEIVVTQQREILARIAMQQTEIKMAQEILNAIQASDMASQEIILCALIYDGDMALFHDIQKIKNSMEIVGQESENFYCAMLNTAKHEEAYQKES